MLFGDGMGADDLAVAIRRLDADDSFSATGLAAIFIEGNALFLPFERKGLLQFERSQLTGGMPLSNYTFCRYARRLEWQDENG